MKYTIEPNLLHVLGYVRPFSWHNWKKGKYDYIIRLRFLCQVSHVALALNGMILESIAPMGVHYLLGYSSAYQGCFAYAHPVDSNIVSGADQARIWETAKNWAKPKPHNLPYDWKGVLGRGLEKDWEDPEALFCSELTYLAFLKNGFVDERTGYKQAHQMAPHEMCKASFLKEGYRINFYGR